jgi:DNA-binding transcriptional regulator WhiA
MKNRITSAGTDVDSEQKAEVTTSCPNNGNTNVSRRLSSYEKLKQENAKLKQDIYNLVRNADKIEGTQTRVRYEMQYKMSDAVWFGDATKSPTQFSGILGCLSNGG